MKRILLLTMVFVMMLVSLGGCYWGFDGHDGGRDGRGGGHDRGGDRGGDRHDERR